MYPFCCRLTRTAVAADTDLLATLRGDVAVGRWLDDGSSLVFRRGARTLFLDPSEGTSRPATRAHRVDFS